MNTQSLNSPKIEDIFESSLNLEDTHYQEGHRDGFEDGLVSGKQEGKEVGFKVGFEVGEELGFYRGCVDVWNSVIQIDPNYYSSRIQKSIKQMDDLIKRYPVLDPENESVQEILDALRLKFRAISATLSVKLEYVGYPKSSEERNCERVEREMLRIMLACCKIYISESRNKLALESIEKVAKSYSKVAIINTFQDEAYNRVGYTLVSEMSPMLSPDSNPLKEVVSSMVRIAFETIDFESHSGTHPRLGIVDHVCFHPLAQTSMDQVACLAKSVATEIGSNLQVPTFLYGAAHPEARTLDSIRRKLGYFKPNTKGNQWEGGIEYETLPLEPDVGPHCASQTKGVVVVGATRWVDNYNVPIFSTDVTAVRRIARRVSERGGGLPSVQAMALTHGENVTEVACNLLDPSRVGADQVQLEVERLATEEDISAGNGYFTDFPRDRIIDKYLKM